MQRVSLMAADCWTLLYLFLSLCDSVVYQEIKSFLKMLPATKHEILSLDAQPIACTAFTLSPFMHHQHTHALMLIGVICMFRRFSWVAYACFLCVLCFYTWNE